MPVLEPMVLHDQKSNIAPHFNHLELKIALMTLTTMLTLCDANRSASGVIDKKVMLHFILIFVDLKNAMVSLMTPLASCDVIPVPMASHDQKSHAVPHFSWFELRNAMALLMMLLVACNTDASANSI